LGWASLFARSELPRRLISSRLLIVAISAGVPRTATARSEIDAWLVAHRQRRDPVNLAAVRLTAMILAPRWLLREADQLRAGDIGGGGRLAITTLRYFDAVEIVDQDAGAESSRRFPRLPVGRLWRREIPREDLPGSRFSSEKAGAIAQLALRYRKAHRFSATAAEQAKQNDQRGCSVPAVDGHRSPSPQPG
jgi:hypothetical protein